MDIAATVLLWGLGLTLLTLGSLKTILPAAKLAENPKMAWVEREGIPKTRLAGVTEVLAALTFIGTALNVGFLEDGLLAGFAAIGVAAQMGLAAFTVHAPHEEPTAPNMVIAMLALVLAWLLFQL